MTTNLKTTACDLSFTVNSAVARPNEVTKRILECKESLCSYVPQGEGATRRHPFDFDKLNGCPLIRIHPRSHPLSAKKRIIQADLDNADLLLLAEGHCLAEQAMQVCHMQERDVQGDMVDLRAASLETLMQMVAAGFGSTLIPALAMKTASARDRSLITRQLELPDTYRRVSLVYRRTFPRRQALDAFSEVVLKNLPDSVYPYL